MGFRIRPWEPRRAASRAQVARTLTGSAEGIRAIVEATEHAVHELEAEIASTEIGTRRSDLSDRADLEAELTRTLLTRALALKREAQELASILERASEHLGGPASPAAAADGQVLPFSRRSTDPGSAQRVIGELPASPYSGPERRHLAADAKMPGATTGNGMLNGGREPKES